MKELYDIFLGSTGVCTDTRKLVDGNLFFALKGPNFDGNKYAKSALENGATHAIVDDLNVVDSKEKDRYTVVSNVLETLQDLARYHRRQCKAKIIGITGSNGKTTTKELIAKVLERKFEIIYTQGNLNNHIGVPLTLLTIEPSTEIAVIEMGANHIGEIADLCAIAEPEYGLITNIGRAHLEGFGSIGGVKKGKGELFDFLRSNEGLLFINTDLDHLKDLSDDYQSVVTYSQKKNFGDQTAIKVDNHENQLSLSMKRDKNEINADLQIYGAYNIPNLLAALNIGYYFGISPKDGFDAVKAYNPSNNRSQKVKTDRNTIYLDSYNANPTSMEHALKSFSAIDVPRKMVVLGDMFELGDDAADMHDEIANLADELFDHVLLIGEHFSSTTPKVDKFAAKMEALSFVKDLELSGYTILLKGSRGMALEQFLEVL